MQIVRRTAAVLLTGAAAMAITAGTANALTLPVVGDPAEVAEEAPTTKEGCDYPGALSGF